MMITAAAAKRLTAPIVSSTLEAVLAIEVSASDLPAPGASPEMTVMTAAMSAIRERRMVDFPFVGGRVVADARFGTSPMWPIALLSRPGGGGSRSSARGRCPHDERLGPPCG